MVSVLVTLKVTGPDPLVSASTLSVVAPDSSRFLSCSQDTEMCLGLKPVAWQMSLDVRWLLLEKASRGGMKTSTLGGSSAGAAARAQGVSRAQPTLTQPTVGQRSPDRGTFTTLLPLACWTRHVRKSSEPWSTSTEARSTWEVATYLPPRRTEGKVLMSLVLTSLLFL